MMLNIYTTTYGYHSCCCLMALRTMVKHSDTFPKRIHTMVAEHIGNIDNKLFRFVSNCRLLLE